MDYLKFVPYINYVGDKGKEFKSFKIHHKEGLLGYKNISTLLIGPCLSKKSKLNAYLKTLTFES